MSDRSRRVLRLVSSSVADDTADEVTDVAADLEGVEPASRPAGAHRADLAGLLGEIDADLARLADHAAPAAATDLRARWDAVRRLCDPADLGHLVDHAESLYEAADSVRRQHTETAEDLGPLWDSWEGPAAEAVQDRVSALARSAHALVVELETTAGRLSDAHDRVVEAVEALADDLAARSAGAPISRTVWDRATSDCARAWDDARQVLASGEVSDVSRSGPRSP